MNKIVVLSLVLTPLFLLANPNPIISPEVKQELEKLTLDEKIGQLFMVATVSNKEMNEAFLQICPYNTDHEHIKNLIENYHVGGIIFLGASEPTKQVAITQLFQKYNKHHKIGIFFAQDCEWGLSQRHKNVVVFPRAMTLGALSAEDDNLIYQAGLEIGKQCKALGIAINFAPVCDVNNNPDNPIINIRSFGENPELVARKATLFMQGMQDAHILAVAKHFPGHGDTDKDSHNELPTISHSRQHLESIELPPYEKIIKAGVAGIMLAHLSVPELAENKEIAASFSKKITTDLLKKLGFQGLKFTDGLGMQALTKHNQPGEIELKALLAGNDILLCPLDVPKAVALIKQAIKNNKITEQEIDARVLKILQAKKWSAEHIENLGSFTIEKINSPQALALNKSLYEAAITLVKNNNNLLPIKDEQSTIPVITCGGNANNVFIQTLKNQLLIEEHYIPANASPEILLQLPEKLAAYSKIIMSLHAVSRTGMIEMQSQTQEQDSTSMVTNLIKKLEEQGKEVIATSFGSAYSIKHIKDASAIIAAYENEGEAQVAAAQTIMGKLNPRGKLPVTPCKEIPAGTGLLYN